VLSTDLWSLHLKLVISKPQAHKNQSENVSRNAALSCPMHTGRCGEVSWGSAGGWSPTATKCHHLHSTSVAQGRAAPFTSLGWRAPKAKKGLDYYRNS